ncbi:GTA-gp10 family protein [Hyphococcus sp.]|uniref:GTA-gp10 family protein n=1 Tax=Hyphococcus sp. TaxID=2038636 RepID=UPI002080359A|nr:MAG: hypothetical protein DHS20C04_24360 [Marinicaulis sp.]
MIHPRGDVRLKINGEEQTLRLTLGALADIEDRLGGGDLSALQARLKKPRVADIILVLHALLTGGGGSGGAALTLEALKASDLDLGEATRAIANAFESLGADDVSEGAPGKPHLGEGQTNGA